MSNLAYKTYFFSGMVYIFIENIFMPYFEEKVSQDSWKAIYSNNKCKTQQYKVLMEAAKLKNGLHSLKKMGIC